MSSMNHTELRLVAEADAQSAPIGPSEHLAGVRALADLMTHPMYQVRRVLRVTQANWNLPVAVGKRARRLARRETPRLETPRPGVLSSFALA